MAGALGGLLVFVAMGLIQWTIVSPMDDDDILEQQVDALTQELDTLSQSINDGQGAAEEAQAASSQNLQDLASRVSEIESLGDRVAALESGGQGAADEGAIADLSARLDEIGTELEASVSDLSQRLQAVEAEIADTSDEERVARAFAAAELKSAVDRGGPFAAELEAYRAVGAGSAQADALEQYADEGLPTRAELVQRFPEVAEAMLAATATEGEDGVMGRLMAGARSMVSIRPTGDVEGDSPEAIVARMEARLSEGDFPAALAQWQDLPESARDASSDFAADLRTRAEIDSLLEEALSTASNALTQGTN